MIVTGVSMFDEELMNINGDGFHDGDMKKDFENRNFHESSSKRRNTATIVRYRVVSNH